MTTTVRPVDHASAAAEAVRALNHATLFADDDAGYEWPADVDAVVAELAALAMRLPQALEQAARWLERAAATGVVGHDKGFDGNHAATLAAVLLREGAAAASESLQRRLDEARQITAHLTGTASPIQSSTGGDRS